MMDFYKFASTGIKELQPYQPGKPVEELERELGLTDVVKLASNENPLGPSPLVHDQLVAALPEIARYPDGSAFLLKQKLGQRLGVATNQLTIGNGSNDVLELLSRVYLDAKSEAIVSQHAFIVYTLATRAAGARLIVVPTQDFGQDLAATLAAVTPQTRIIFIANPNNPTGTWVSRPALEQFLDALRDDVLVVLDEAYFEFASDADYPDGVELGRRYPNLVVTRTFSKAYGLAALRIGYAVSHPDVADLMNRVRQPFNVNSLSMVAALAALDDPEHVQRSVESNNQGMAQLEQACQRLDLGFIPSAANFLTIDFGRDAMPIYDQLLHRGVIVRPIGVYEMPDHLRVTIGTRAENERFINALNDILR